MRHCVNNRDLKLVVRRFQDNDREFTLSFFPVQKLEPPSLPYLPGVGTYKPRRCYRVSSVRVLTILDRERTYKTDHPRRKDQRGGDTIAHRGVK